MTSLIDIPTSPIQTHHQHPRNLAVLNSSTMVILKSTDSSFEMTQSNATVIESFDFGHLRATFAIFVLILVFSIVGNIFVILFVRRNRSMQNTTNSILVQLAIADLAFSTICISHTYYQYKTKSYNLPEFVCKFANYINHLTAYVSIYFMVIMSLDRLLTVVYGPQTRKYRTSVNTRVIIGITWILMIVVACPFVWVYNKTQVDRTFYCTPINPHSLFMAVWICFFAFGYVIPLMVIITLYSIIIIYLIKNTRGRQVKSSRCRVTCLVFAVIISFAVCWLPMQCVTLCYIVLRKQVSSRTEQFITIAAKMLVYINHCLNPFLYVFASDYHRRKLTNCFGNKQIKPAIDKINTDAGGTASISMDWQKPSALHSSAAVTKNIVGSM